MSYRIKKVAFAVSAAGAVALVALIASPSEGQGRGYRPRRMADGRPDLNGIWQAVNSANWDLQSHQARPALAVRPVGVDQSMVPAAPVLALGAAGGVPAGIGVVVGEEIPYLPEAAAKKNENAANWLARDPEIKCYLPGVPRATYMPYPFQIIQGTKTVTIAYEFAGAVRTIEMGGKERGPADSWMGWSNGRWEEDTLVVDVTDQNDQTWFDRAGNFHSEALHVVERYTPASENHLMYEATIEDPKVFSRSWKIRMPLYRRLEPDAQVLEYNCSPFVEELMYGKLRKTPLPIVEDFRKWYESVPADRRN